MPKLLNIYLVLLLFLVPALISCKGKPGRTEGLSSEVSESQTLPADSTTSSVLKYKPPSDPAKEQAMQEASLNGDLATVSRMITEGADVNAPDPEGPPRLHLSVDGHRHSRRNYETRRAPL